MSSDQSSLPCMGSTRAVHRLEDPPPSALNIERPSEVPHQVESDNELKIAKPAPKELVVGRPLAEREEDRLRWEQERLRSETDRHVREIQEAGVDLHLLSQRAALH